jgi:16S rRNA (cytidine1402-2'-O)-methyltransferase
MENDAKLKYNRYGVLIIVGTPIGNLMDLSPRGVEAFKKTDFIVCEDTRVTKRLAKLRDFSIKKITSLNDFNETKKMASIVDKIKQGNDVILTCDAGMPLVSDPGYKLVSKCIENKIQIDVIPGPSAIISALVVSGLAPNNFFFAGFPPKKKKRRIDSLKKLLEIDATLIWFESPKRVLSFLNELLSIFGNRQTVIAKELTKLYQEILRNDLKSIICDLKKRKTLKGEYVVLLEGRKEIIVNEINLDAQKKIYDLMKTNSVRSVVNTVVKETNLSKNIVYKEILRIKEKNR